MWHNDVGAPILDNIMVLTAEIWKKPAHTQETFWKIYPAVRHLSKILIAYELNFAGKKKDTLHFSALLQ